jgi:hypothetical protein
MKLSHPILRAVIVGIALAFAAGCGGGASQMNPQVASQTDIPAQTQLPAATSCAGNVCFTYVDQAE